MPIDGNDVRKEEEKTGIDKEEDGTYVYYLHFFKTNNFWGETE